MQGARARAGAGVFASPSVTARLDGAYSPRNLVLGVVVPAFLTAIATILSVNGWATGQHGGPVYALPWFLVVMHVPSFAWTQRAVARRDARAFMLSYGFQALVQINWLLFLCWFSAPFFVVVGVMILVSWVFNDAWVFHGAWASLWPYVLGFGAFNAVLLVLDVAGHDGLIALHERDSSLFLAVMMAQGLSLFLVLLVLRVLGLDCGRYHRQLEESQRVAAELALRTRERDVLRLTSGLLSRGLAATKFSHDINSPLGALVLVSDQIRHHFDEASQRCQCGALDRGPWLELMDELGKTSRSVIAMSAELARGLRQGESGQLAPLARVIDGALTRAALMLGAAERVQVGQLEVPELEVWCAEGLESSLANLIANAVTYGGARPLEIRAEASGPWFARVRVRDFGVEGEERQAALRRIQARIGLGSAWSEEAAPRVGGGKGIALTLAKVLLLKNNGWLDVHAAEDGPGLVAVVVLPRCLPGQIPADENRPDAAAHLTPE
ncbi:MAG: HAMP domain-containing histidine kinase [Myxococcales bacterium]|nr:HAMP domain-containing histidine kinase [Myxococcales bacterium]